VKDSRIESQKPKGIKRSCLNVKGSNYRFWRSADGSNLGARDRLRSSTVHQKGTSILVTSRTEHDSVGYSARSWVVWAMQASLLSVKIRGPKASWSWNISTFANRTTTSFSSSFSLILSIRFDHLLWRGPTSEGGT